MKLHVQFSDETEIKVVSWFSSPQPPELDFPFTVKISIG